MSNANNNYDKKLTRLPLIVAAALPLTAGLVFASAQTVNTQTVLAQTPERVQPVQPGQRASGNANTRSGTQLSQPRQQSGTNYADVFLKNLAAQLGISVDRLRSAAVTAGSATVDQGVKAGDFPNDASQNMKADLQQNPFMLAGHGGRGGHGHGDFGGRGGFGDDGEGPDDQGAQGAPSGQGQMRGMNQGGAQRGPGNVIGAAVAKSLGLSESALRQELQGGKTIAQVAQAKGVSTASVHAAALSALQTQLAADVQAGRLQQAQAAQMLQQAQADPNFGLGFGGNRGGPRGAAPSGQAEPTGQITGSTTSDT